MGFLALSLILVMAAGCHLRASWHAKRRAERLRFWSATRGMIAIDPDVAPILMGCHYGCRVEFDGAEYWLDPDDGTRRVLTPTERALWGV